MADGKFIPGGAFHISRTIFNNEVWQDADKFRLWVYLLGKARHRSDPVTVGNIKVGCGQYLRSYRQIAEDCQFVKNRQIKKWSLSHIKRMVDELVTGGRIEILGTELGTLFTICNYKQYQSLSNYEYRNLERDLEQPENNNKNDKNEKHAAAADSKEFYNFVNKFVSACKNNGLFINENAAMLKLKQAYYEYGFNQMRLCFNDVIDKALKKQKNGERIRCVVQYGLKMLRSDYKPIIYGENTE